MWDDWYASHQGTLTASFARYSGRGPEERRKFETLCVIGDFKNKVDEGGDVAYPGAEDDLLPVKFYNKPSLVVTVKNALETDRNTVINKTARFFRRSAHQRRPGARNPHLRLTPKEY